MSLGDWLGVGGLFVGVLGLLVAVLGFRLTIRQLTRTATASEATVQALSDAARRMNTNHLLVLLPQLQTIQNDLDASIVDDDHKSARRALVSYVQTASQVAALLRSLEDSANNELIAKLISTANTASSAKSTLVTAKERTVLSIVRIPQRDIAAVSTYAAGLVASYQVKVNL